MEKVGGSALRTTAKILAASIAVMMSSSAIALEWDADPTTPGVQGGSGLWNGGAYWWNGSQNVPWMDGSFASFTGTAGTVDVGGMSVNGLSLGAGYTLRQGVGGGALTLIGNAITTYADWPSTTISAPLAGVQGLRKLGPGTLTLTGINTYTGDTVIEEGWLTLVGGQAIPDSSSVKVEAGASLSVFSERINGLSGSGTVLFEGALTVGASGATSHFTGSLIPRMDGGSLIKEGGGVLTLSGSNSYKGPTTINQGTLVVSGGNAIPDNDSSLTIAPAGSLHLLSNEMIPSLFGAGAIKLEANTLTIGGNALSAFQYAGAISGTGGVTIRAARGMFSDAEIGSSFTGNLTIAGGEVYVSTIAKKGVASALGAGEAIIFDNTPGRLMITGSSAANTDRSIVINGSQAILSTPSAPLTLSGEITGSGALNILAGDVSIAHQSNTFAGGMIIGGASVTVSGLKNTGIASPLGVGGSIALGSSTSQGRLILLGEETSSTDRQFFIESGGGVIQTAAGTALTVLGTIAGSGALTKEGAGVLTLGGANAYAGGTIISGGKIAVNGGFAIPDGSFVTMGGGSTLQLLDSEVVGGISGAGVIDLGMNRLTVSSGLSVAFTGTVAGSGSLLIKGVGLLTLSGVESSFTGGVGITGAGRVSIPYLKNSGELSALGASGTITLGDESGSGTLSVGEGASDRPFTLGAKGGGISVVAGNLVLSGPVHGDGSFTKTGAGALALENVGNSFSGDVTVAGGILSVTSINDRGVAGPLGSGGSIKLSGGTLHFKGVGEHSSNRSLLYTFTNGIAVEQGATLTLDSASGTGGFQKLGAGTLVQRNPLNSFAGEVRVTEGVLETGPLANAGVASALGMGNHIVLDGGQLSLPAGVDGETNRQLVASGGRIQITNSTISLKGVISGSGSLTFAGSGAANSTLILAAPGGQSTQTGVLRFQGLSVRVPVLGGISDDAQVELMSSHLVFAQKGYIGALGGGAESIDSRVMLTDGLYIDGHGSHEFAGVIEGAGGLETRGYVGLAGANTFTGDIALFGSTISVPTVANSGVASPLGMGSAVRLSDGNGATRSRLQITAGTSSSSDRTLSLTGLGGSIEVVNPATTVTWSGQVNGDTTSRFTKEGAGTLRLTGANGFTGAVDVRGGSLQVVGGNALPNTGNVAVAAGATLDVLFGSNETIGSLEGAGHLTLAGRLITGGNDRSSTFSGAITGAGEVPLVKRGSGTFTLTHVDSSFIGGVHIADGAVSVPMIANSGLNSPLGKSGPVTLGDEGHVGRLIVTQSGLAATDRPFSLRPGGGVIDVANSNTELTLSGPLDGTSSLLKLGSGRLRIVNDKSFSGGIVVADGILDLDGSIPGAVTVLNTAVLETSGASPRTIGSLTVAGGTLSLGGPGVAASLNTGDLTLAGGTFAFDLSGSGHDQVKVTGSVLLKGYIDFTINLGIDPEDFVDAYRLVLNDGNDITTVFDEASRFVYQGNVLEEGETFLVTSGDISQYFQMHYGLTPEDNDIRIVAAPEPGSAAMLVGGMLCLLGRRKRRLGA